jgi:hypothetical protein
VIDCDSCGAIFDPVSTRWLCPNCRYKASCCEGEPLCGPVESATPAAPEG